MSEPHAVPFSFHDIAACFSDEEWKLFLDWQKELYNSVMKEIQQAVTSLGPLIATSVFSLRAKEKGDAGSTGHNVFERRLKNMQQSTGKTIANPDLLSREEMEESQHRIDFRDTDRRDTIGCLFTGDVDFRETVSFIIKEEKDNFFIGHQDFEPQEIISVRTRDAVVNAVHSRSCINEDESHFQKKTEGGNRAFLSAVKIISASSIWEGKVVCKDAVHADDVREDTIFFMDGPIYTSALSLIQRNGSEIFVKEESESDDASIGNGTIKKKEKSIVCQHSVGKVKESVLQGTLLRSQLLLHPGTTKAHCENEVSQTTPSDLVEGTLKVDRLCKYGESDAEMRNPTPLSCHQNSQQNWRPHTCTVCGKNFAQKRKLMLHLGTHTGEKPYPCTVCGKGFREKNTLVRHHRTHTGEKPYPCAECGRIFRHRSTLVNHQRTHTGEKPYSCTDCGRSFHQIGSLIYHQRKHTGEKPYVCSQCGKLFRQSSALANHKRIHIGKDF